MTVIPLGPLTKSVIKEVETVRASPVLEDVDVISAFLDSTTSAQLAVVPVSVQNMLFWIAVILKGSAHARMESLDLPVTNASQTSTTYQLMAALLVIAISLGAPPVRVILVQDNALVLVTLLGETAVCVLMGSSALMVRSVINV